MRRKPMGTTAQNAALKQWPRKLLKPQKIATIEKITNFLLGPIVIYTWITFTLYN